MSIDLDWWEPLTPEEVAVLLQPMRPLWWIAGGWAIDLFLGAPTRLHQDVDVGLLRRDQAVLHDVLPTWELFCADPPGRLRPWLPGEVLAIGIHDIWARPGPTSPWQLQFMLNEGNRDDWIYRRDERVSRPLALAIRRSSAGVPYLAPEIQLLFKANKPRPHDEADWANAYPRLDSEARRWLDAAVQLTC